MNIRRPLALLALLLFTAIAADLVCADDWPQWRGPTRDGISKETGLLHQWPKDGPKLVWQNKDVGSGYSTPAVVGDRLYMLSNRGTADEFVQARSTKDGRLIWEKRIGKVGNPDQQPPYPGARSTPTVDGSLIFALGSDGDLACLETATGNVRWTKNVRTEFGGEPGVWAYSESPLVDGELVVCTPGGKDSTLLALNKKTGEVAWKCPISGGDQASYASIVPVSVDGVKQYVQFVQNGLIGVDAKTGKFLWRYENTSKGSPANIPTPLVDGSFIYSATGMSGGGLVELKAKSAEFDPQQIYFSAKLPNSIGGAVRVNDALFGTTREALTCVDFKSGKQKWADRSIEAGSICYADGCLYLHGENGDVALVEANPDSYHELGRFTPSDSPDRGQAKAWTYPVIAGGKLYVRDGNSLWCYEVQAGKGTK